MAEVNPIDFNKVPRQKFSAADMQKIGSIMHNVKVGNMDQATLEFDEFTRDKKMDKVRSIGLKAGTAVALIAGAIILPHACPKWFKKMGDAIATGGANAIRKNKKLYDKIINKLPQLKGNVGEDFATRALDNADLFRKVANKVALGNKTVGGEIVEGLSKRNIHNLGDIVGIGIAALASVPTGNIVSDFGNMLDEYGDGDRELKEEEPAKAPKAKDSSEEPDGGIKLRM